ncbi:MAG: hypothetical protein ACJASL_005096 [Paraglaciecola sp.]
MGGYFHPVRSLPKKLLFLGKLNLREVLAMAKAEYTVLSLLLIAVLVGCWHMNLVFIQRLGLTWLD